jgi:predicted RNase H-like HicB family nuclease
MARYIALIDGKAGAYGVVFPDLPGCAAMSKTVEQAISNAGEALRDWIGVKEDHGESPPVPQPIEKLRRNPDVAAAIAGGATLAAVPLVRETGKPVKANLSIDSGILAALDEEAARRRLTRSAFVEMIARRMLSEVA